MRKTLLLLASTTVAVLLAYGMAPEPNPAQAQARPNIVFVLTDDMREDDLRYMPETKEFVQHPGMTLKNAYVADPMCCPSRATILTGEYPHNHGVLNNVPPHGGFYYFHRSGGERHTIATKLKSSGYRTALFGKYLNGYCRTDRECPTSKKYVPPGWTEWHAWSGAATLNNNGTLKHYGTKRFARDDVLKHEAADFIQRAGSAPVFMYIAVQAPHENAVVADRHKGLYTGKRAPRNPNFNEADVSDKPAMIRSIPRLTKSEIRELDAYQRYRLRTLRAADDLVGRMIEELAQKGELANTYFFFTSDHGYEMGEHRLAFKKRVPYEESLGVPLVVRGPGIAARATRDAMVLNTDFAPTFADIANTTFGSDGRSMLPLLRGQRYNQREVFLYEDRGEDVSPGSVQGYQGVRTARWSYTARRNGARELYDMRNDPWQLENIYDMANPMVKQDLAAKLRALKSCAEAGCRRAENGI